MGHQEPEASEGGSKCQCCLQDGDGFYNQMFSGRDGLMDYGSFAKHHTRYLNEMMMFMRHQ